MDISSYKNDNKFLHIDYDKDLDAIEYSELNLKDILDFVILIDSYIYNKFGSEQKNNLILNNLFDELSQRINIISLQWRNKIFENSLEISNKNKILQTIISTDFLNIIISLFKVCSINTFCLNNKLVIVTTKNIKTYLVLSVEKIILEKINKWEKSNELENLIAVSNDLEFIKNELEKLINLDEFILCEIEKIQIEIELGEINYMINTTVENILDKISNIIIYDLNEAKIPNTNLQVDTIIVTIDDYLCDLIDWMLRKNLISLIEKLHIKIINSDLIEKISLPRDRFEEYIRIKLEKLQIHI